MTEGFNYSLKNLKAKQLKEAPKSIQTLYIYAINDKLVSATFLDKCIDKYPEYFDKKEIPQKDIDNKIKAIKNITAAIEAATEAIKNEEE